MREKFTLSQKNNFAKELLRIIVSAAVVMLAGTVIGYFTLHVLIRHNEVTVPDIRSKYPITALEKLNSLGLQLDIVDQEYSNDIPANFIIKQSPEPGSLLKKGRKVKVILSKGSKVIPTPNLCGKPILSAKGILKTYDLYLGNVCYCSSDTIPKDCIIAQYPPSMSYMYRNSSIDILVSTGPKQKKFMMPDLIGTSLHEALNLLKDLNVIISSIKYKHYGGVPKGMVIGQIPDSGYQIVKADNIALIVSDSSSTKKNKQYAIIDYKLPVGVVNHKLTVLVKDEKGVREIINRYAFPAEEINLIVEIEGKATAEIYLDETFTEEISLYK